jgi:hypothetical protein
MVNDNRVNYVETNIKNKEAIKVNEEYSDCLMKIMKAIQSYNSDDYENDDSSDTSDEDEGENKIELIRSVFKGEPSTRIHPLTMRNPENVGLSNKARFTLLDIYEGIQKF